MSTLTSLDGQQNELAVPDGFEDSVTTTPAEFRQQLLVMAALKMFELGKISSGRAAELAGQSKAEFLETCARYGVSVFNYPPTSVGNEIANDLANISRSLKQ